MDFLKYFSTYEGDFSEYVDYCINTSIKVSGRHAHHILPRAQFPEFIKESCNIAWLTPAQHIIAHKLLFDSNIEFQGGVVALYAKHGHLIESGLSEEEYNTYIEKAYKCSAIKISKTVNTEFVNENGEVTTIAKERALNGEDNGMYGKTHTKEVKEKHSQRMKGNKNSLGHKNTDKQKKLWSEKHKNRKRGTCIHCGITMDVSNLGKYHNNNCKYRP